MVDDTFARLGEHPSVIGPVTVTAIELQAARGIVAPIPDLVESALDRIPPGFPGHAAAVVAAGAGALADLSAHARTAAGHQDVVARRRLADTMLKGPNRQSVSTRAGARTLLVDARKAAARLGADPLTGRIDTLAARAHLSLDLPRAPRTPDEATAEDRLRLTERRGGHPDDDAQNLRSNLHVHVSLDPGSRNGLTTAPVRNGARAIRRWYPVSIWCHLRVGA